MLFFNALPAVFRNARPLFLLMPCYGQLTRRCYRQETPVPELIANINILPVRPRATLWRAMRVPAKHSVMSHMLHDRFMFMTTDSSRYLFRHGGAAAVVRKAVRDARNARAAAWCAQIR